MQEFIDMAQIVRTVQEFLHQLMPGCDPKSKYEAQVAIYLLDMVKRELASPGATVEFNDADIRKLCEEIRTGARDADWDRTLDEVLSATIHCVKVTRPDHLSDEHR